ncbi:TonB-dependent receptor [Parabacteroides sp. OttesenSCG-928-G06]|nr:TonB-dependent receptor [Parabacteroides sp. OttesenSCG-928-G06]
MRLTCILFLFTIGLMYATDNYAQTTMINLQAQEQPLEAVLKEIEKQSEFDFFFNNKHVNLDSKVSVAAENKNIFTVLDEIFEGTNVKYTVLDKKIILSTEIEYPQQVVNGIRVTGTVVDNAGEPVIGATIVDKSNAGNGTITNYNGEFTLTNIDANGTLVISYVGYVTQELKATTQPLHIRLLEDTQSLEEVVVVGYGTQKKVNLTGAVAVVDGAELHSRPVANITQSLQGLVPGLTISATNKGGTPGASYNLNIRGQGNLSGSDKPYVLVDGMEQSLDNINPNDIESISVLKDAAAAAIYGARAAYGVILITTKKGKDGKISFNYNGNFGVVRPINIPDRVNSYEFAKYFNAGWKNGTGGVEYSDEKLALLEQYCKDPTGMDTWPEQTSNWFTVENSPLGVGNTNFYDIHYKDASFKQDHNLSGTGGNDRIQYYVSGGYYSEDGLLRYADIDYKRFSFNSNITAKLTSWLKLKANTKYSNADSTTPFGANAVNENMFFHNIVRFRPTVSPYDTNGRFTEISQVPYIQSGSKNDTRNNTLALLTGLEITPLKGWVISIDYNYRYISTKNEQTALPALIYGKDNSTRYEARSELAVPINGSYYRNMWQSAYNSLNVYTTYDFSLNDKHNFKVMVGGQEDSYNYSQLWSKAADLLSFNNPGLNTASGTKTTGETRNGWATRGFFGRINYDYEGKYLLEVNARYDGSSRFAKDSRWGFFPSVSLGYNIARENYMEWANDWLTTFKLRGSYGFLGNQAGAGLYTFAETMGITTQGSWFFNNGKEMIINAPGSFNPNTTWEKIESGNIGVDFGFLNNSLTGSFEVYQRTTRDMLGPTAKLADMYGTSAPQTNNAVMRNRGWELNLTYRGRINKDTHYSVTGMLSDYDAEVLEYENPTKYNPAGTWYPGRQVGEIWGYRADALIQTQAEADEYNKQDLSFLSGQPWKPGDVKYKDLNGDGKINRGSNTVGDMGDQEIIGNTTPHYQFSVNGAITWKRLSLSMLWQGVGKRDYNPGTSVIFYGAGAKAQVAVSKEHLDYWREDNPGAYYPNPYIATVGGFTALRAKTMQNCDRYIQNAAYLRLKNLTIGYDLPENWIKSVGLQRVNVYFSGENLLTFTKLPKFFEPETVFAFQEGAKNYFQTQVFSFGLNVSF